MCPLYHRLLCRRVTVSELLRDDRVVVTGRVVGHVDDPQPLAGDEDDLVVEESRHMRLRTGQRRRVVRSSPCDQARAIARREATQAEATVQPWGPCSCGGRGGAIEKIGEHRSTLET